MDFIGIRKCEEREGTELNLLYSKRALFYDQRFRISVINTDKRANLLNLVLDDDEYFQNCIKHQQSVLIFTDPYEEICKICNYYLQIIPRYMVTQNNKLCLWNRESFRYWLARKINLLIYGTNFNMYSTKSILHDLKENKTHLNPIGSQLQKNFMRLPIEVVSDRKLSINFEMPVVRDIESFNQLTEQWLKLMTWWKLISSELHPILCKLRAIIEKEVLERIPEDKQDLVSNLDAVYYRCLEWKTSYNIKPYNFLIAEYEKLLREKSNFPRLTSSRKKDKLFYRHLLEFSANTAKLVVVYLVNLKRYTAEECFLYLVRRIEFHVSAFYDATKGFYRRRHMYSKFEHDECQKLVLRHMESILKKYLRKTFFLISMYGDKREMRERTWHRIQKFHRRVMEAMLTALIDTFYAYYIPGIKKGYAIKIVKNLILHLTWTAMNLLVNDVHMKSSADAKEKFLAAFAKPLDIESAELLVSPAAVYECTNKVFYAMKQCETQIYSIRPEKVKKIFVPLIYVYEDFSKYLRTFDGQACPHPIRDFNSITESRLRKFMLETVVCLHHKRLSIEEVFQNTKEYLRFFSRINK